MKGQSADCVTSSGSMEILTGIDGVPDTAKQRDINHNTLTTVEITPVKAPSDIKSAIRRQKRTETLDYIWHALPASRSSKPLYRAVLRGSLHPGSVQCTITNVNGPPFKTPNGYAKDESPATGSNNNEIRGVSHPGFGLRVAGVSINEIKFQEPAGRFSPRSRLSGQTLSMSRHMKANFLDQRSSSPASGFKNRTADNNTDAQVDSPRNSSTTPPMRSFNGFFQSKTSNGYGNKVPLFTSVVDEDSNRLIVPLSPSISPSPVASEWLKGNLHFQTSMEQKCKNNDATQPTENETRMKPNRGITWSDKSGSSTFAQSEIPSPQRSLESASQTSVFKRSLRLSDSTESAQAKEPSIQELTCMQLADSILGAVNGDLSQVYSLCKSKLRYSDYIEQSQANRLGDTNTSQGTNVPKVFDPNNSIPAQRTAPHEPSQTKSSIVDAGAFMQPQSSLEKGKESTRLPMIKATPKSYQHVTSRYLNYSSNKTTHAKGSEIDLDMRLQPVDTAITFGKASRPILKTFKSDVESSSGTPNDQASTPRSSLDKNGIGLMDTNNNPNGVPSNRLVRFNTCHEVREFTPSEPIRQH